MALEEGDLLIAFNLSGKTYLDMECQTAIDTALDPDFFEGFKPGFFCEATDIQISMKMGGSDSGQSGPGYGKFGPWNYNQKSDVKSFPIEFEEVSFDRFFDVGSPTLFQQCALKRTFDRIIALRLRNAGKGTGPRPYLRMEFTEVLFTGVTWSDAEVVKEKCSFRCRSFKSSYRLTDDYDRMGGITDLPAATWKFDIALLSDAE